MWPFLGHSNDITGHTLHNWGFYAARVSADWYPSVKGSSLGSHQHLLWVADVSTWQQLSFWLTNTFIIVWNDRNCYECISSWEIRGHTDVFSLHSPALEEIVAHVTEWCFIIALRWLTSLQQHVMLSISNDMKPGPYSYWSSWVSEHLWFAHAPKYIVASMGISTQSDLV